MESAKWRGYRFPIEDICWCQATAADYAAKNKYAAQLYNLTPETINQLFAVYEN